MQLEKKSPCKVNLLLNILGKRADGFHELETVMHPVPVFDELTFQRGGHDLRLTCSLPSLPTDSRNLVFRAAAAFLQQTGIQDGVRVHLEKRIPLAAGLGGGSGNAATTLLGLNELFGNPLDAGQLAEIAASLGSDVPFFLRPAPALGTGRGELIQPLAPFQAFTGTWLLLIHPGFGISTPWAYQSLARFPQALNGQPGRAQKLISLLQNPSLAAAASEFYNSLEAPALEKYPILALYQEFLRTHGALTTLMSGSGSTTFAVAPDRSVADMLAGRFREKFGNTCWMASVPLNDSPNRISDPTGT